MHLRVFYFDQQGVRVHPRGTQEALLPLAMVPGMKRTARDFLLVHPEGRLRAAVSAVAHERAKLKPLFLGVATVACPSQDERGRVMYQVAAAMCSPKGDVLHCKWSVETLQAAKSKVSTMLAKVMFEAPKASGSY